MTCNTAVAGVMHSDATYATYTDFGQNKGRYVIGDSVNALLQYIRDTEGGIGIEYTDGTQTYYISNTQGMIDYSGVHDGGHSTLVSVNMLATVLHNGSISASFNAADIGEEHALNYSVLDIRGSNAFRLGEAHGDDFMLQRQTRIVTDAVAAPISTVDVSTLTGQHMYHVGAGTMGVYNEDTDTTKSLADAYLFNIGDIDLLTGVAVRGENGQFGVFKDVGYGNGIGASLENPLPNATRAGDSGSPVFIYNADTGQYEYLAAHQSGNGRSWGQARGNLVWAQQAAKSFDVAVNITDSNEVHIGAVTTRGETITDNYGNSGTIYMGTVRVGDQTISFNGVQDGQFTWLDMSDIKDSQTWYTYDAELFNAQSNKDGKLNLSDATLFHTENLVFSSDSADNRIVLDATVDMGAGYVEFNKGSLEHTKFTIVGEGTQLHTAGYVINEGAEVHLQLTNPAGYMTEWRKVGAGDLYIDGKGNTNALLNVGGEGTTYLQQTDGYAAYNVLVNTGATVVIKDATQIKRDLTFGAGGGTLDMNGNSMEWYTTNGATPRSGSFTINALTDAAMITNSADTAATLTYKEGGDTVYKGSFSDSKTGALHIDYQGGGTWYLHSIRTDLSQNAGSGLTVSNGKVVLVGTNTMHGTGSANGLNLNRYENSMDWHYADATMDVTVQQNAVFELGSHARLTGDVSVKTGGAFVMREGVQHAAEYIEGGTKLQNTADFADFYGLKGGVSLESGAKMLVQYGTGVTAATTYGGNISGEGNVEVNLGSDDMSFILSGTNTFSGSKNITTGGLVARSLAALGSTSENKWLVQKHGWIASRGFKDGVDILSYIDGASEGTLALSHALTNELDLKNHQNLYIGAEAGKTVQYGAEGTSEALDAQNSAWRLGGGGGDLVVNFKLEGANDLLLGANENSTGSVYLANSGNTFSGTVQFNASGIKLGYAAGALGESEVNLTYGNGLVLSQAADVARVATGAEGMLLLEHLGMEVLDLTGLASVALGASIDTAYSGNITLDADAVYRFGAMDGATLRIDSVLDSARDVVVDAQGSEGGSVLLAGNESLSGNIVVQGHKDATQGGSISLAIGRDVTAIGSISLGVGTKLDVAGHQLTVTQGLAGSGEVVDSATAGALIFDTSAGAISNAVALNLETVRKRGANTLSLTGAHSFGALFVDGGSLSLTGDFSSALNSRIYLADGSALDIQTTEASTNLAMLANAGTASVRITAGSTVSLNGDILLGSGSRLNMMGTDSTYVLTGSMYGGEGATLSVQSKELHFETGSGVDVLGTLSVENNLRIYSNGTATDMERNIGELKVNNNAKVTLDERTWNTVWNIDKLTGAGEVYWYSNTTHDSTSRLVLRGEGDFTGTISMDRQFENENRTHGAFIELAHDKAAKNASVSLNGASANAVASLAVNTKEAQIKGLSGNEFSYVYAGQAMAAAELRDTNRPPTTRSATLAMNVDSGKTFTYAGTVGQSSDTLDNGLSLYKTGAGTQQFTGTSYVNHVTAQQGTLELNAAALSVRGDVGVGYGATLNMGDYTLASGKTFSVLAGASGASGSASFGGTLTLAGGTLSFSGAAMSNGGTTLNLGGLNTGSVTSQTVRFTDTSGLQAGQTYTLATGDWSSVYQSMSATGLHYYDATFGVNAAGNLQVSLALKSNCLVWDGSGWMSEWSNSMFGDSSATFNSTTTVVFDDSASYKYVGISSTKTISAIVFNSTNQYDVVNWGGNVKATDLVVQGGGSVFINGSINITGTTTIEDGELILQSYCNADTLQGTVTGDGTLVIDGASGVNPNLVDLHALHIKNGSYGSTSVETLDVDNIIVDASGRYIHGSSYEGKITSNGGILEIYKGSLGGELELTADTTIDTYSTNTSNPFRLNSLITDNGHSLIQTGGGLVEMTTSSRSVLNHYVVRNGKLVFAEGSHSGHGNITVESGSTLRLKSGANLMTTSVSLTDGSLLEVGAAASLMSDVSIAGRASVTMGNESSFMKGSVAGAGTLALTGQGVVQSRLADSSTGALALEVGGTSISLLAANTHSGGTTLNSGSLYARNAQALGTGAVTVNSGTLWLDISGLDALSAVSSVTLNSGSVLDVSAATFTADTGLLLGGSMSVGDGAYINLGNLSTDNVKYTIFDLTAEGASVADWLSMQDRIMVNGSLLSSMSDYTLGLTDYGATITFGTVLPDPLIWQGGEIGTWDQSSSNWDNTPKIPDDSVVFTNGDSVEFTTSATVQVADGVVAQNMSIGEGVELALSGDLTVSGAIIAGGDSFSTSGNLSAEKITVAAGSFETAVGTKLTAESLYQKGGSLSIKGAADIGLLDVAAGLTAELYNNTASDGAQKQIDAVHLGKGATLSVNNRATSAGATTLGAVQLNGETATIQDVYNSGHVVIETLNMNSALDSATLSLVKKATSDKVSRFEFGTADAADGNFKGCVELRGELNASNRPVAIILSGQNALAEAVVSIDSTKEKVSYMGLGVNVDQATIAGLESGEALGANAKLFSGTINANCKWDASYTPNTISTTERTLNINTAAGSTHTFYGEVLAKLNLVKQGEGTQVLNGASSNFDGSLTVEKGTLKLGANALTMLGTAESVTVSGGMLDLSAASYTENSGLALGCALSVTGGIINLGSIDTTGTYTIFDLSADAASTTDWESWEDKLLVNGACLNRYEGASLSLADSAAKLSFTSLETTKYSDLVWNGGAQGVWDQSSQNWNRSSVADGANIMFLNGDSVSFNEDAEVTVEQGVTVANLTLAEGATLTTHGGVTVNGSLSMGDASSWILADGTEQSLTESQLSSITSSLVVEKGATLTMTDKTTSVGGTSAAFANVSGAGDIALNLAADNGIGVNTSNVTGDIIVLTGRLQVNACTFNSASTIRLATADSQLVFHSTGTELKNNVELKAANTSFYVNWGKTGTISGIISGEGGLKKMADGTLTFAAQNTYKGATTITGGKIILNTGGEYNLYNTVSDGTLEVASGTTLANNGHAITSTLVLNTGSTWKVSADATGEYTLNSTISGEGKIQVLAGTTFKNNGKSLPGTISLDAGSSWLVTGTSDNTYTLNKAVSGTGTVEVATGSTLLVDGDSNENLILSANVKVNAGATLAFADDDGNARSDMLDYNATSKKISVAGGSLDFGGSRQTMGAWKLELSGGATVSGAGGIYDGKQAAMDFNKSTGNIITATSGNNTISATTRLRNGSELTYNVAQDTTLNVTGLVHADGKKNGGIVKDGAGTLYLNNTNNDLASVVVKGGAAKIQGASEYTLATLQAAAGAEVGFYTATLARSAGNTATVSVSNSALVGGASTLDMNLDLAAGSTLEITDLVAGPVTLNGALTLGGKVALGSSLLADVLTLEMGESLHLFTGDALTVSMGSAPLTEALVSSYFTNAELANLENVYVTYTNVANVGNMYITYIPEPSSATLSILALAGMMLRRRRK